MKTYNRTITRGAMNLSVEFNRDETSPVDILIYDEIGKDPWTGEGLTAKDIAAVLSEVEPRGRELRVRINSRGGEVDEGKAIRAQFEDWPGRIVSVIDGVAASTASWMIPADEVQARKSAQMFIHKSWAVVMGNADDLRRAVEMLSLTDGQIADLYAEKTKRPAAEMMQLMAEETLLTASRAAELGFVDTVLEEQAVHNFSDRELTTMKGKLAALNSVKQMAVAPKTEKKNMSETSQTLEATPPAAQIDLAPVIAAINKLGETMETKKMIPAELPGAPALGTGRIENLGNPAVETLNRLRYDVVQRAQFIRENYQDVFRESCRSQGIELKNLDRWDFRNPVALNANTVDGGLANSLLAADFITVMRAYFTALPAFTRQIEPSPLSKRQVLNVPLVSSAGSMQTNATNYETGDTVAGNVAVTVNEYSKSFHVSRPEQNLGLQLSSLAPTNAKVIGEGVAGLVTALMTNANYGADNVIGAAADFSGEDLRAVLALGKDFQRVTLLLDGGHLAYLLPQNREAFAFGEPGAYGFDGGIYKQNLWTGAAADICGFLCGPDAIVIASGPPLDMPAGEAISTSTTSIAGLPFQTTVWWSRATRAVWASFQMMFGCAKGDTSQGKVLTTV